MRISFNKLTDDYFAAYPKRYSTRVALLRRVVEQTAEWGRFNPYWYSIAYVEIKRGGGRIAYCRYASDQGTSTFAVIR